MKFSPVYPQVYLQMGSGVKLKEMLSKKLFNSVRTQIVQVFFFLYFQHHINSCSSVFIILVKTTITLAALSITTVVSKHFT